MSAQDNFHDSSVHVIGHRNPDTDSICSAIAYSNLKNRLSSTQKFQAVRAGDVNKETQFVLNYLNVDFPPLMEDVRSRVSDICNKQPATIHPDTSINDIYFLIKQRHTKSFPVVDREHKLQGLVTMGDIAIKLMDELESDSLGPISFDEHNLVKILKGKLIHSGSKFPVTERILAGAMSQETLPNYVSSGDAVILGNREEAQNNCLTAGASYLILTGDSQPTEKVIAKAHETDSTIISTPYDTSKCVRLLTMAIPVKNFMNTKDIISFYTDDLIEETKNEMLATRYRSYPVLDHSNTVIGTISRQDLLSSEGKQIILVDHNDSKQAVSGIEEANIEEIVDHHKLGDLSSSEPIYFRNEPIGSTASIITKIYLEHGLEPDEITAGLLLSAVLSDTVMLKSPTSTSLDAEQAEYLSYLSGLDINKFGKEMFRRGAEVIEEDPLSVITKDFKEFSFGDKQAGIGQMNTVDYRDVCPYIANLQSEMQQLVKTEKYDLLLFMITDIERQDSLLLLEGTDCHAVESVFNSKRTKDNTMYLENVVSRKKQVVPPLSKYFSDR